MSKPTRSGDGVVAEIENAISRLATLTFSEQSERRLGDLLRNFGLYSRRANGIQTLSQVNLEVVRGFVRARSASGPPPSVATMHLRRSALRLLFRLARDLSVANGDPTLDLALPPRSGRSLRPLTDEEILLCRSVVVASAAETRLPTAWALAEASATSSEVGCIRAADIDLEARQVWLSGGARTSPRHGHLTEWGALQIQRRMKALRQGTAGVLLYAGRGSAESRQAAGCMAISETLRRAGLGSEPDVRPASVRAWAGLQMFKKGLSIDEVARGLGMRSLDRAADLIGWHWRAEST